MLLIAVSYRRCGRDFRAKFYTAIKSLSANHAYLKTLYHTNVEINLDTKHGCHKETVGQSESAYLRQWRSSTSTVTGNLGLLLQAQ